MPMNLNGTAFLSIEQIYDNLIQCRSFSYDILFYDIGIKDGYLYKCNCPDSLGLCKHIFLTNRITNSPYSLRSFISPPTNTDTDDTDIATPSNEPMPVNLNEDNI